MQFPARLTCNQLHVGMQVFRGAIGLVVDLSQIDPQVPDIRGEQLRQLLIHEVKGNKWVQCGENQKQDIIGKIRETQFVFFFALGILREVGLCQCAWHSVCGKPLQSISLFYSLGNSCDCFLYTPSLSFRVPVTSFCTPLPFFQGFCYLYVQFYPCDSELVQTNVKRFSCVFRYPAPSELVQTKVKRFSCVFRYPAPSELVQTKERKR